MKKRNFSIKFFIIISLLSACTRSVPNPVLTDSLFILNDTQSALIITQSVVTDIQHEETYTQPTTDDNRVIWIIDNHHVFWIIEPILEYDNIIFCSMCGYTANTFSFVIDKFTGQIIRHHDGHGGPYYREWLYDFENKLFGERNFGWGEEINIHYINQFSASFTPYINTLNYVRQIDFASTVREENNWGEISYNKGEKYENSKYAIAYGNSFLTDFIYDRFNFHDTMYL